MRRVLWTGAALALCMGASLTGGVPGALPGAQPAVAQGAQATKPFLHPLFTDNMVLQRGVADPVWGWTEPGQRVTVSLKGASNSVTTAAGTTTTSTSAISAASTVVAGADGKWMAKIGPFKEGGPYTLTISGPQTVTLTNVMVGDVWICSGQSNMQWGVGSSNNPEQEIAAANYPDIRLFTVPNVASLEPRTTVNGKWDVCSPQTVGGFSAVGYFFGRTLNQNLKVPIGLINSSWGGTIAEAWASAEALKTMPDFAPAVAQVEASTKNQNGPSLAQLMAEWWTKNDPGTAANWQDAAFDAAAWKTMTLPAKWEDAGLGEFDGVAWFRKEVTIPDAWAGKDVTVHLGPVDDNETTFFNGTTLGATEGWMAPRDYKVPGNLVKAGRNVIAVRVLDTGGAGGVYGQPADMRLEAPGQAPISLSGGWLYKDSVPLNKTAPSPMQINNNPNVTTVLYNGMIAPLVPFGIKGAIWYQGESNAGRDMQYRTLLPTMIKDWRSRFGVGEFPFYIVQLANFMQAQDQPGESAWAALREAQALTSQTLPNTGLATAIDIGEANDIHPRNKQEVGRRLALNALAKDYGQKIEYSGPIFKTKRIDGGKLILGFDHAAGIAAKNGEKLRGFAIVGDDKKWAWADATIVGSDVVLFSPTVPNPIHARYNWADNPNGNLTNAAGLPAVPFRTDMP